MAAHEDPVFYVEVAGVTAEAFDPEGALVAAFTLLRDAAAARVSGYVSASFFDAEGVLVSACDGAAVDLLVRRLRGGG